MRSFNWTREKGRALKERDVRLLLTKGHLVRLEDLNIIIKDTLIRCFKLKITVLFTIYG